MAGTSSAVLSDLTLAWLVLNRVSSDSDLRWAVLGTASDVVVLSALAEQGRITVTLGEHNG